MKEFWNTIQLVFAAVGGWLGYFLGGCDGLLYALIAFVAIDYITGVMCAISDKTLSSEVGFRGICRKVLIFLLVGIGNIIDSLTLDIKTTVSTCTNNENRSKRMEVKELICRMRADNPQVEARIFASVENVSLDAVVGYKTGGRRYSFLDTYDRNPPAEEE